GLGFNIEGGLNSPLGHRPISIKKLHRGVFCAMWHIGDVIVSVNGTAMEGMTSVQAWNHMKTLTDGEIKILVLKKKKMN
ncbi:hypothetical protein HELRODRAFT_75311, partial [Helobdella robusta]|uniref:PDZ domain-containing protein n=1 Tax=Helobdella robusta TaxID=6412 RepID=T1G235_HELRO